MARRNIDDFPISMSIRTQISQPSKAAKLANDALFQKVPNYKKKDNGTLVVIYGCFLGEKSGDWWIPDFLNVQ